MATFKQFEKNPMEYANSISVENLEKYLRKLSEIYYNDGDSPISDKTFDELKDILSERDPANNFLTEIGAPIKKDKVKLPFPMGSLNKVKPDNGEFEKWIKKYRGPYELSDKMDGISAMIHKKEDITRMYSRGDGLYGQDITGLLKYLNIDTDNIPNNVAVRGELIMSKKNFKNVGDSKANARNTVAGIVNSKTTNEEYVKNAKLIDFIAYNVVNPIMKQDEQYDKLDEWKFNVVHHKEVKELSKDQLSDYFSERRIKSNYDIDGIVVMDNNEAYDIVEGNPKNGFAFKSIMKDQYTIATVEDVEWEISKHKFIKPRIRIEPVKLVGVTIKYATAHNAKFIYDNKIGVGSRVKIIRSGDVIPKILEVLSPSTNGMPKMPSISYEWNDTGVDIIVVDETDESSEMIKIKKIVSTMTTLDVKYINEGIITKFVRNGYDSLIKIIKANRSKINEIIGEKMTSKIYDNLERSLKNTQLHILMAASNYFGIGMGVKKIRIVTKRYPNIMVKKWSDEKLRAKIGELSGFQEKTIDKFAKGFCEFKIFFNKLGKYIDIEYLRLPTDGDKGNKFAGQKVVLTGFRDSNIIEFIERNGGIVTGSVSKNTALVVCVDVDETSTKLDTAKKLGIRIITKDYFIKNMMSEQ